MSVPTTIEAAEVTIKEFDTLCNDLDAIVRAGESITPEEFVMFASRLLDLQDATFGVEDLIETHNFKK